APSPQGDVAAGIGGRRRHAGARIQPQLGIFLAEADAARARHELGVAEWCQQALVEGAGTVEIAHRDRDVIDHVSPQRNGNNGVRPSGSDTMMQTLRGWSKVSDPEGLTPRLPHPPPPGLL